ncbi:MAG TPA: hypothetical protein VMH39_11595 [Gemmatimonadaceae bacterium]|nr:hypothetical protein [Gemmatimonadaceae bacterium]
MHPDVAALLIVQADDVIIREIETGITNLLPRLSELAAECERARGALAQATLLAEQEERRRRDIASRLTHHRQLQEKHMAVLNAVTNQREATAATAQVDQVARTIAEAERDLKASTQRVDELRRLAEDRELSVAELETARREAQASVDIDRAALESRLAQARTSREAHARDVSKGLLSRYDRIRSKKRVHAVFALRGASCSNCDTMLPLQRRSQMSGSGATEVCEGCGVLLYATE